MHQSDPVLYFLFLVFAGAGVVATLVLYTRQSLLVAYMLLGMLLGPTGLGFISDSHAVSQIGNVGIIFLLFLLGLNLQPSNLIHMLRKTTVITVISSLSFALFGFVITYAFGFTLTEAVVVGIAMMFSSTIIGLKLLPTTILHHQHTGEVMISLLLMQDLVAIISLLFLHAAQTGGSPWLELAKVIIAFPVVVAIAFFGAKYVLLKLMRRFDRVQEYLFLLAIAWCVSFVELATYLGLSAETGAFIAGVSIATNPVSLFVAESLKPLRDFFLVLFFFAVGAEFNRHYLPQVIYPALSLAAAILLIKPVVFKYLLQWVGETKKVSFEVGVRLAQGSEFSLLVAYIAFASPAGEALIGKTAYYLLQATMIFSFIASSYWVVLRYPTPLALDAKLRRD